MKTSQATSGLLRRHYLGNFHSDLPKSTLSIKSISAFLDLRRAQCDLRKLMGRAVSIIVSSSRDPFPSWLGPRPMSGHSLTS